MSKKGLGSAEELEERVAFIRQIRDELVAVQKDKGIPMPYEE